jgi:hypothetical protein
MCQMHTCHSLLFDVHRGGLVQFPQTSLREIATLKMLRHPNIVGLKEVVVGTERERCVSQPALCSRCVRVEVWRAFRVQKVKGGC